MAKGRDIRHFSWARVRRQEMAEARREEEIRQRAEMLEHVREEEEAQGALRKVERVNQWGQVVQVQAPGETKSVIRLRVNQAPWEGWTISIGPALTTPPLTLSQFTDDSLETQPGNRTIDARYMARVRYGNAPEAGNGAQVQYLADIMQGSTFPAKGTFVEVDILGIQGQLQESQGPEIRVTATLAATIAPGRVPSRVFHRVDYGQLGQNEALDLPIPAYAKLVQFTGRTAAPSWTISFLQRSEEGGPNVRLDSQVFGASAGASTLRRGDTIAVPPLANYMRWQNTAATAVPGLAAIYELGV